MPNTWTAANVTQAAVQAVISAGTTLDGDTVIIPAGTATGASAWTTLTITKNITLQGSGSAVGDDGVVINGGVAATMITIDGANSTGIELKPAVDGPDIIRITNIAFDHTTGGSPSAGPSDSMVTLTGKGYNGVNTNGTHLRVDHCRFTNGGRAVNVHGWSNGVIDNNRFINCNICVGNEMDGGVSWARVITPGTSDAMFNEDNTFVYTDSALLNLNEAIYHDSGPGNVAGGARTVTRYNHWDMSAYHTFSPVDGLYDVHGNYEGYYSGSASQARGAPMMEFYNNDGVLFFGGDYVLHIRGGSILAYNNTFNCLSGSIHFVKWDEEEATGRPPISGFSPGRSTWPAQDGVANSFFWNNTLTFSGVSHTVTSADFYAFSTTGVFFLEATPGANPANFWMHQPQSAASATPGKNRYTGTRNGGSQTAPTPTDPGNTVFDATGDNAYYNAAADPTLGYIPYTYPHPLRGASPPPPPPVVFADSTIVAVGRRLLHFAELVILTTQGVVAWLLSRS